MAWVAERTGVVDGKHGPMLPRARGGFRPGRRQEVRHRHVVVSAETIGRLGLRPIAPGLIARTLGQLCQTPTELAESCGPSLSPPIDARQFCLCPTVRFARLPRSLPGVLGSGLSLEDGPPSGA